MSLITMFKMQIHDSPFVRRLLLNFCFIFSARGICMVLAFINNVLLAHVLSVEDVGQFNLVINLSNIIIIPLVFGVNTSALRVLPDYNHEEQNRIAWNVIIISCSLCLIVSVIAILIQKPVTKLLRLDSSLWYLAIILAIFTGLYIITETFLKSRESFKYIGIIKLVSGILIFSFYLFCLFSKKDKTLTLILECNILSQLLVVILILIKFQHPKLHFNHLAIKSIYSMGFLFMTGWMISTLLNNSDIIILSNLSTKYDVGIYTAYVGNTRNYFLIFYQDILATVLLPTILNSSLKRSKLYQTLLKWLPVYFIVITIGTSVVTVFFILCYGSKYPMNGLYILWVSLGIGFLGVFNLCNTLIVTEGKEGAKFSVRLYRNTFLFLIGIIIGFTHHFGIYGTFFAHTINQFVLAFFSVRHIYQRRYS